MSSSVIHSDSAVLFSAKKSELTSREKTQRNLQCALVKEASLKRLSTVWFQLYDLLGKVKLWRQLEGSVVARKGRWEG